MLYIESFSSNPRLNLLFLNSKEIVTQYKSQGIIGQLKSKIATKESDREMIPYPNVTLFSI
ncbi:hypothetical protein CA2015_2738 [Cyclobacterium amurskyense]|uniref:Uncharacterized protein n=1 Tax=Cyclobacterium amurskyense TaxID=320787 RepID=A0A0H4PH17_9BACT|nr:hypothetical protein CA2015_2738 [Cyclobacterium amurskyense]